MPTTHPHTPFAAPAAGARVAAADPAGGNTYSDLYHAQGYALPGAEDYPYAGMAALDANRPTSGPTALPANLELRDVSGDGQCLFRAIVVASHVQNHGEELPSALEDRAARELRALVVDYMEDHPDLVQFSFGKEDPAAYCADMRHPRRWGGEPELFVASEVLQVAIVLQDCRRTSSG